MTLIQVLFCLSVNWLLYCNVIHGLSLHKKRFSSGNINSRLEDVASRLEVAADRLEVVAGIRTTTQTTTTTTAFTTTETYWHYNEESSLPVPCDEGNVFKCTDGLCIPANRRCNGGDFSYDCSLMEDEYNCEWCQGDAFLCPVEGRCIGLHRRCDGWTDCERGYDEENCDSCGSQGFFCSSQRKCLVSYQRCNMIQDCTSGEDEDGCECALRCDAGLHPNHYSHSEINSTGTNCLRTVDVCDGYLDCADGQDERDCACNGFRCSNYQCVPLESRCDGHESCANAEDEQNCVKCNSDAFRCPNGRCIYGEYRCNGIADCEGGADEINCDTCNGRTIYCQAENRPKCGRQCDGTLDCSGGEDEAGCDEIQFRLVEGSLPNEGRLEVLWQGQWGSVCGDRFDYNTALVACKQLGYPGPDVKIVRLVDPSEKPKFDSLHCQGNETSLLQCFQEIPLRIASCWSSPDLGLRCDGNKFEK